MIDTFRNMLLFQLTMDQCFAFSLCVVERLEAEGKVFNKGDVEGQGKIFGDWVFLSGHCYWSHDFRTSWEKVSSGWHCWSNPVNPCPLTKSQELFQTPNFSQLPLPLLLLLFKKLLQNVSTSHLSIPISTALHVSSLSKCPPPCPPSS